MTKAALQISGERMDQSLNGTNWVSTCFKNNTPPTPDMKINSVD